MSTATQPFIVLTAILDASARPAALTRSHGDALERAIRATSAQSVAGLDLVELPIAPQAFAALRKHLQYDDETVAVYDVFPLSSKLDTKVRGIAGQFLAAEALWTLEEQGLLAGVPLNVRLDIPKGWDKSPKSLHAKLMEAGALDLTAEGIETFKAVKTEWEATQSAPSAPAA
jgi:hypothetical protein